MNNAKFVIVVNVIWENVLSLKANYHVLGVRDSEVPGDAWVAILQKDLSRVAEIAKEGAYRSDNPSDAMPLKIYKVFSTNKWLNECQEWHSDYRMFT